MGAEREPSAAAVRAVDEAITTRHSVRAFLDRPVPRETLHAILDVARWAPSGTNIQPWQVHVLAGEALRGVADAMSADFEAGGARRGNEFDYYPNQWFEPYLGRRRACGWGLYGALGIERGDRERTRAQTARNYRFFGAPAAFIVTIDRRLEIGSWLDLGMFVQNIMVAARARGLHTCPQAAIAGYHQVLREHLSIPGESIVVCAVAIGHADPDAPENRWRTDREPVEAFTRWHGV